MERRSTAERYVHFGGDVVSNVESSHGVRLSGGSTNPTIESFGDDTNIGLTIRAKNAAPFVLGNSSNTQMTLSASTVTISSGSVFTVGSTAPFAGMLRFPNTNSST